MEIRAVGRTAGLPPILLLLLSAGPSDGLCAQAVANRSRAYLHPTGIIDARAVWLNPAGLGARNTASIHLDLSVEDPGAQGRLRQVTAGFSSRGLGFSYQRDALEPELVAHTYRLGIAGAAGGLAAGVVAAHYRGAARATAWDAGVVYTMNALILGAVVANIGEPDVRGTTLPLTLIPGATLAPLGPRLAVSAHASITRDSVLGYAVGARWSMHAGLPVTVIARLDTDRELRRSGFAFGLSIGIRDVAGAVVTTPGDLHNVEGASLYAVVARALEP